MEQIFVSSLARGDMAAIRQAARDAVESLEMRPVMFETGAPSGDSSRRALLDRLAQCDAVVLLLGREYGESVASGVSPTEEEFTEACERGIPVLALVQHGEREDAQNAFVRRVRGPWEEGRLTADFTDAGDVGLAVVRALNAWRRERSGGATMADAEARALELARGEESPGVQYGGSKLRVVMAPAVPGPLIDALKLRDQALLDDLPTAARTARLVPQTMGIEPTVGHDRIEFALTGGRGFESLGLAVGFDGSVVIEGPVGGDDQAFGGSVVMADRARAMMGRAAAFAEAVWQRVDARDEVRQLALICAVPDAEHKVYALEPVGSSMSVPMTMPRVLIAPGRPLTVRREDLARDATQERLEAELRRAFEVAGALHPQPDATGRGIWS